MNFAQLRREMEYQQIPLYCYLTRELYNPVWHLKWDIHEAIIKRNRLGKEAQAKHADWLFSMQNCALLNSDAHNQMGQHKRTVWLHVWHKLNCGIDMTAWAKQLYDFKAFTVEALVVESLIKDFKAGTPLRFESYHTYYGPNKQWESISLIWPVGEPIWRVEEGVEHGEVE